MRAWVLMLAAGLTLSGGKAVAEVPANQALAEQLLVLMKLPETLEQTFAAMRQAMPAQLAQMSKAMGEELPPEATQQTEKTMQVMSEELCWDKMKEDYVGLYATTFTAEELQGLIAFYQSPAGQAFIVKQPALMQASMQLNQKLMLRVIPRLKEIYKKDAKKDSAGAGEAAVKPAADKKDEAKAKQQETKGKKEKKPKADEKTKGGH